MNMNETSFSEFVCFWEKFGMAPLEIIAKYLIETNQEAEALTIIPKLAKDKSDKIQRQLDYARSWIPFKVDTYKCNKNVTRPQAKMLETLTDYYCLGMDIPEKYIEEVKEVIPNMETPTVVFIPMVEWLRDKYNIMFKDWYEKTGERYEPNDDRLR